jgi:hypothetical protein
VVDEPKDKTKSSAQKEASGNRKVDGGVFAAMDDIAGETPETEGEARAEEEQPANDGDYAAENEERPAEFAERVHAPDSRTNRDSYVRLRTERSLDSPRSLGMRSSRIVR